MKTGLVLPQWSNSLEGVTQSATDVIEFDRSAEAIVVDSLWLMDHIYYEPCLPEVLDPARLAA